MEIGPEMPHARPRTHERAMKHQDQVSSLSHLHSPLWGGQRQKKMLDFHRFPEENMLVQMMSP